MVGVEAAAEAKASEVTAAGGEPRQEETRSGDGDCKKVAAESAESEERHC